MPNYLVKWDIELDAETPEQAAEFARDIQRDTESEATTFLVTERVPDPVFPGHYVRGNTVMVDLDPQEES